VKLRDIKDATKPGNFLSNYVQTSQIPDYCSVLCWKKFYECHNTRHFGVYSVDVTNVNNTNMAVLQISELEIEVRLKFVL
jgi:hypothetical protein